MTEQTARQRKRNPAVPPTPFGMPDPAAEQVLAARMGVHFDDPYLLRLALTHRSVLHDWRCCRKSTPRAAATSDLSSSAMRCSGRSWPSSSIVRMPRRTRAS